MGRRVVHQKYAHEPIITDRPAARAYNPAHDRRVASAPGRRPLRHRHRPVRGGRARARHAPRRRPPLAPRPRPAGLDRRQAAPARPPGVHAVLTAADVPAAAIIPNRVPRAGRHRALPAARHRAGRRPLRRASRWRWSSPTIPTWPGTRSSASTPSTSRCPPAPRPPTRSAPAPRGSSPAPTRTTSPPSRCASATPTRALAGAALVASRALHLSAPDGGGAGDARASSRCRPIRAAASCT